MLPWNISFMHGEGLDMITHQLTDVACAILSGSIVRKRAVDWGTG